MIFYYTLIKSLSTRYLFTLTDLLLTLKWIVATILQLLMSKIDALVSVFQYTKVLQAYELGFKMKILSYFV